MNVIETLEALGDGASERPWSFRPQYGSIITQGRSANPTNGAEDREYYGGALIGESIGEADRTFITAAINALPHLLKLARTASAMTRCECYVEPHTCIEAGRSWESQYTADRVCDPCRLRTALEPLLKEDPS